MFKFMVIFRSFYGFICTSSPQYFLEVGAFGVSERIVTEDFCEVFNFFIREVQSERSGLAPMASVPSARAKAAKRNVTGGEHVVGWEMAGACFWPRSGDICC